MSKRLFTSDWHLNHNAILKYRTQFNSIEEHDQNIFDQLSVLNKRDIVFVLGDILFDGDKYDYYIETLSKMSCRFKFILGNHDSLKLYKETRLTNMELCLPLFSYKNMWISHAPIHPDEIRGRDLMIHGHCIPMESEILTKDGWKNYSTLTPEDLVYTMNPNTLKLEYNTYLMKEKVLYTGNLFSLNGRGTIISVTDKHRMVTIQNGKLKYLEADKFFNSSLRLIVKAGFKGNKGIPLSDVFLKLYIVLATDGSITPSNLGRIRLYKERKINKVRELLLEAKVQFKELPQKSGGVNFHFKIPDDILKFNIKGLDKALLECNLHQVQLIKETYSWTDGNRNLIFTSKKQEADILQHLFIINGYSCKLHSRIHGFSNNESYQLSITPCNIQYLSKLKDRVKTEYVDNREVWCININNSNFFTRLNGSVYLTGNCHFHKIETTKLDYINGEVSKEINPNYYNVCLDVNEDKFVPFEMIEQKVLRNKGEMI